MAQRRGFGGMPLASAALGILLAASAEAQSGSDRFVPPRFGTKDLIFTHVMFTEFRPEESTTPYYLQLGLVSTSATASTDWFDAAVHVPSGALLAYLELDYCDESATKDVWIDLEYGPYDADYTYSLGKLRSSDGPSGCSYVSTDLSSMNFTMDNNSQQLVLFAGTEAGDSTTRLRGVYVGYKLQISPPPSTPTFGDVPTSHPYYRAIEALAKSGITGGCGGGNFCPNSNVTRGEMAAFLARALGLHFPY